MSLFCAVDDDPSPRRGLECYNRRCRDGRGRRRALMKTPCTLGRLESEELTTWMNGRKNRIGQSHEHARDPC